MERLRKGIISARGSLALVRVAKSGHRRREGDRRGQVADVGVRQIESRREKKLDNGEISTEAQCGESKLGNNGGQEKRGRSL